MSSSSIPTPKCLSPFSNSMLNIPSINYNHTMKMETLDKASQNGLIKIFTIELQIQHWYKVYVEPYKGCELFTLEEDYLVSPKFSWNFMFPFLLSSSKITCQLRVEEELNKLPLSHGLVQYLKPLIVDSVFESAQTSPKDFRFDFDVRVVKIDLADHEECENYRKHG
ncbi:hypothetical protein VNO78_02773 [Psophocarpus tetragonolobus]|uniref:Uncharacterized protein n=1 Tax=Psophocarpus tetragonolobus TaxID=3891 RepID=A0AAN9T0X4_PSOTE